MIEDVKYPIRINAYLAKKGVVSRREADKLISAGKILINGRKAVLGDKVDKKDQVEVDKNTQARREAGYIYLAFNKPEGVVTNPENGQTSISDLVNARLKLIPIGRLDKESRGLIILTNDTRITSRLLDSENEHEKEYRVVVDKAITPMFQKAITSGLELDDFTAKPCKINKVSPTEFFLTLTEGKKHQIRRMCAALGYQVRDLKRERIMNINLGKLKPGEFREITGHEQENFLRKLRLK